MPPAVRKRHRGNGGIAMCKLSSNTNEDIETEAHAVYSNTNEDVADDARARLSSNENEEVEEDD